MSGKRQFGALAAAAALTLLAAQTGPAAAAAALDPGVAPGGNFTLNHWELQLPTGTTGKTTTISPSRLIGANGYQDKYFYTDAKDGAMSFEPWLQAAPRALLLQERRYQARYREDPRGW